MKTGLEYGAWIRISSKDPETGKGWSIFVRWNEQDFRLRLAEAFHKTGSLNEALDEVKRRVVREVRSKI